MSHRGEIIFAYLAGYIDADGCLCLSKRGNANGYVPDISVTSTYKPVLDNFKAFFGGIVYTQKPSKYSKKPLWKWSVNSIENILETVNILIPYLSEKKGQAILLQKYCEWRLQFPLHPNKTLNWNYGKEIYKELKHSKQPNRAVEAILEEEVTLVVPDKGKRASARSS